MKSRSKRNCVVRRIYFEDQSRIDAVCREIREAKFLELTLWGHARQSLDYETSSGSAKDIALHTSTGGIGGRMRSSAARSAATSPTASCTLVLFIPAKQRVAA